MNDIELMRLFKEAMAILDHVDVLLDKAELAHQRAAGEALAA